MKKDHFLAMAVGDGLCCGLTSAQPAPTGSGAQIDWGSRHSGKVKIKDAGDRLRKGASQKGARQFPRYFVLSHYHADHYNGLASASCDPKLQGTWRSLQTVYGPGFPRIPERRAVYEALYAMNQYMLGNRSGHPEYDFLAVIGRMAGKRELTYRRLFRGHEFRMGPFRCTCAWPPKQVSGEIKGRVLRALQVFHEALEMNPDLQIMHKQVTDSALLHALLERKESSFRFLGSRVRCQRARRKRLGRKGRKAAAIRRKTKEANGKLREVANSLSLAFYVEDRFLFLGDLAGSHLESVVKFIEGQNPTKFRVLLAAHHGTYWHRSLARLHAEHTVVSCGRGLYKGRKKGYKSISDRVLYTHVSDKEEPV